MSGCCGDKLKRRDATCTRLITRKRLNDLQTQPNPSQSLPGVVLPSRSPSPQGVSKIPVPTNSSCKCQLPLPVQSRELSPSQCPAGSCSAGSSLGQAPISSLLPHSQHGLGCVRHLCHCHKSRSQCGSYCYKEVYRLDSQGILQCFESKPWLR